MIDNHGHIGKQDWKPEDIDIVEGYDPSMRLGGQSHETFISLMDAVGVGMAVLDSARWANKYLSRIVREHPGRFISVCRIDESTVTTDETCEVVRTCVEDWGFKGLYFDPPTSSEAAHNFHTEEYERFWKFVDSLRVPVCFVSLARNFETLWPDLLRLLGKFPELTVVIVHGLYPACLLKENNEVVIPESALRLVRDYDVQLDLLTGLKEGLFGPNDEVIKTLYDTFGPSKLLWGSEFTKVKNPTVEQYSYQLHYLEQRCKYVSREDLRLIVGENARRVYGLA